MNDHHNGQWKEYLSDSQKDLLKEGECIRQQIVDQSECQFDDYSFIVFPYAKAYEGFLKKLFLDVGFISKDEYTSDHFRIGKSLSPGMVERLGDRSIYEKITRTAGKALADELWLAWRNGRNQVFHYFPHNTRALRLDEATVIIDAILMAMKQAVIQLCPIQSA